MAANLSVEQTRTEIDETADEVTTWDDADNETQTVMPALGPELNNS